MYATYKFEHQAAGDASRIASYPVFRTAFSTQEKKTAFRHSKGAFQTCEFCNICRHLIAKSKSLDDNDPDKLTPDAIQLVAEMMVLHRAKQGNFLFHPFALLSQFSPD